MLTVLIAVLVVLLLCVALLAGYLYLLWNRSGRYIEADGVRLHYVEQGTGAPVILVHGFAINLGGNWFFPRIFQRLAREYRVIALDNRGHGRSTRFYKAEDYGTQFVEDIIRLMDRLHIEKAHVIGYSLGGFIVLKLAEMYPERLLSVAPCGAGWTNKPEQELSLMQEVAASLESGAGFTPLLEWLEPPNRPKRQWLIRPLNALMCWLFDIRAMAAIMRNTPQLMVSEEALRQNRVPALAVIGDKDPLRFFADQMAAVMANLKVVVVPGGDHGTTLFGNTAVNAFRAFLAEHTPTEYKRTC